MPYLTVSLPRKRVVASIPHEYFTVVALADTQVGMFFSVTCLYALSSRHFINNKPESYAASSKYLFDVP